METKTKKPRARHAESARKGTPEAARTRKVLSIRLSPELRAALEARALSQDCTPAAMAEALIESGLAGT